MKDFIEASIYQLGQMRACICLFSATEYAQPLEAFSGSSVGMHLRHVIEFYQHLLSAVAEGRAEIDYDTRQRSLAIERCPAAAIEAVEGLIDYLPAIGKDRPLTLAFACHELPSYMPTALSRELCYNVEHCIHHLAIVKVGMKAHFPHKELPSDFGLAYSTKKHLRQMAASERFA